MYCYSQPQNSIPDVIIWMLSGNKRVACKRIPSHLVMFSTTAQSMGKLCAKQMTFFLTVSYVGFVKHLWDTLTRGVVRQVPHSSPPNSLHSSTSLLPSPQPPALSEEGELKSCKDRAQVTVTLWLGKTEYTIGKSFEDIRRDGNVNVCADTVSI